MSHRLHGDVHELGLADACDDCEEIAANPFALADERLLLRFIEQAVQWPPRTIPEGDNEAVAVKVVLDALERAGKLAEVAPDLVGRYLRERWRADL